MAVSGTRTMANRGISVGETKLDVTRSDNVVDLHDKAAISASLGR
jgi:hypothetical protein